MSESMSLWCFLWCFFDFLVVELVVVVVSLAPLDAAMPEAAESLLPDGLATLPLDPEVSVAPVLPEVFRLPLDPLLPLVPAVSVEPVLPEVPMLPLEPELPVVLDGVELVLPVEPDCANAGTANARTPIRIALPILFPPWSLTLLPAGNIAIRATA